MKSRKAKTAGKAAKVKAAKKKAYPSERTKWLYDHLPLVRAHELENPTFYAPSALTYEFLMKFAPGNFCFGFGVGGNPGQLKKKKNLVVSGHPFRVRKRVSKRKKMH